MASLFKILVRDFTAEEKRVVKAAAKRGKESLQKMSKRGILREAGVDPKREKGDNPLDIL